MTSVGHANLETSELRMQKLTCDLRGHSVVRWWTYPTSHDRWGLCEHCGWQLLVESGDGEKYFVRKVVWVSSSEAN